MGRRPTMHVAISARRPAVQPSPAVAATNSATSLRLLLVEDAAGHPARGGGAVDAVFDRVEDAAFGLLRSFPRRSGLPAGRRARAVRRGSGRSCRRCPPRRACGRCRSWSGRATGRSSGRRRPSGRRSSASPLERKASQGMTTARTRISRPKTMKVRLLISAARDTTRSPAAARISASLAFAGTRGTSAAARTRRSAASGGRARARGGSGSCAARRRPRAATIASISSWARSKEAFGGKRPSRPPTRWTWTSTGISGMPQVKISTQAAVLRPTPGSESRNSSDSSRGAVSVQSRSGSSPSCSRIAWIRGAFCLRQAAGPDRLLDLGHRRVAHFLPGREALAQRREGAVAVAVVGVLGEHRLDQLGDRLPVRLVDRLPVHLPQPVADRPHAALVRSLPGHRADPSRRHLRRR